MRLSKRLYWVGYDPKVWLETDAQIRDMGQADQVYGRIVLPPPVKGKHKYSHCSHLYTDIHKFLGNREWAPRNRTTPLEAQLGLNCSFSSIPPQPGQQQETTSKILEQLEQKKDGSTRKAKQKEQGPKMQRLNQR